MKILIVEDILMMRRLLEHFISEYGECDFAEDGMEAYKKFLTAWSDEKPYDLICLDIMLPLMDGLKVIQKIREFEKIKEIKDRVKILIVSARKDEEAKKIAQKVQSDGYLTKPVTKKDLDASLANIGFSKKS